MILIPFKKTALLVLVSVMILYSNIAHGTVHNLSENHFLYESDPVHELAWKEIALNIITPEERLKVKEKHLNYKQIALAYRAYFKN